jgi:hypothetical protein
MTRRRLIFQDPKDRLYYLTPEFNGDKEELERMGSADSCDKNWSDIAKEFQDVMSLVDFNHASIRAQLFYHSSIAVEGGYLPLVSMEFKRLIPKEYQADELYWCFNKEVERVY